MQTLRLRNLQDFKVICDEENLKLISYVPDKDFAVMLPVYARDGDDLFNWSLVAGKQQVYLLWNIRGSTINDLRYWDMIWPDGKSFDPRKSRIVKTYHLKALDIKGT